MDLTSGMIASASMPQFDLGVSMTGTDYTEAAKMQQFSGGGGTPWWQGLISYGITRAIDNRYGPPAVSGNVAPGTFAGQDGRTYAQQPQAYRGQPPVAPVSGGLNTGTMLLLGAAAVAVYLIAKG